MGVSCANLKREMYTQAQFQQTRKEIRYLRIQNAGLKRWHLSQKDRADRLEEEKA
jgi:hypothetical protein